MTNTQIKEMFEFINVECAKTGEQVVPVNVQNLEYYENQMINLEFSQPQINSFCTFLRE